MTVVDIAWASVGATLQVIVIGFAYDIGRHNGYPQEEYDNPFPAIPPGNKTKENNNATNN